MTTSSPSLLDPLNIENWYPHLKSCTFETEFVPIEYEEAVALVAAQEDPEQKYGKFQKDRDQPIIDTLTQRLDTAIKSIVAKTECTSFFVRLSTRSPKDASLKNTKKVEQILLENIKATNQKRFPENELTLMLVHSFHEALKVTNAQEAIAMIMSSKRSYHDLFVRTLTQDSIHFQMVIAVRRWATIVPGFEFRGFVHKNKLTALSQYFQACFVSKLRERKQEMLQLMQELFEKEVKNKLEHIGNYVIDFALVIEDGREVMKVVELNHFQKTTGAGLFDWKVDEERFKNGPFEFRIIEEPISDSQSNLYEPLREVLRAVQQKHGISTTTTGILNKRLFLLLLLLWFAMVMGYFISRKKLAAGVTISGK